MADVNLEILVPEIAGEIYVKFQRNLLIVWVEKHVQTNVSIVSDVKVSEKLNMAAACNRKWNSVYLSLFA